ncbi:hypothetical protein DL96DRAFT_418338 [Flagelloscypha sp. PMI_526]|nr:hypothetical protein DL96DRAFT_418338 [Flagelloscypha sp. PMI_526]
MHSLDTLPEDLLVTLISFCSIHTIVALRRCSKMLESISRQRLIWLTVLREQIEEADMTLAQIYPFSPKCTTSLDLELYATARYRFFWRLGAQPTCIPCSVGTLYAPEGSWRTAAISSGGQWIAAIYEQCLRIYHLGAPSDYESRRGVIQPKVLAEETLNLLSDTEVSVYWDSCEGYGHVLEIYESEGELNGTKYWLFHVHVPESSASPLRLELISAHHELRRFYTLPHGTNHPVICMSSDQSPATLWFREGVKIPLLPLKFGDDVMFYTGINGFIAVCGGDGLHLTVYRVPNIENPQDGDSLELIHLASFNWSEEMNMDGISYIGKSSTFIGSPRHGADTGRFVAHFVVTVQTETEDRRYQTEFFHKDLIIYNERGNVVRCELVNGRNYIVPRFRRGDNQIASPILYSSNSLIFLWFADANWRIYFEGDDWQAMVYAILKVDSSKDRTAFLGFSEISQRELHPERLDICTLSGRGLNYNEDSLYIFDWALEG